MSAARPPGFYVYRLVDPRNGRPFYVGKGQGARAWQHERAVASGNHQGNAAKVRRIAEILSFGLSVSIEIVDEYELEADALDHEFRLVDADPTLTNVMPGGIGRGMSPGQSRRLQEQRERRLDEARKRDHRAAGMRELARRREMFGAVPGRRGRTAVKGADRHRDEIEGWLQTLVERRDAREVVAEVTFAHRSVSRRGASGRQKLQFVPLISA